MADATPIVSRPAVLTTIPDWAVTICRGPAEIQADHRHAARQRLKDDGAPAVVQAGKNEQVVVLVETK